MIKAVIIIILCAGFGFWIVSWLRASEQQYSAALASEQTSTEVMHRFAKLDTKQFDKNGQKKFQLHSPKAAYKPDAQTSIFQKPEITITQPEKPTLVLFGDSGVAKHDSNALTLIGDVIVKTSQESSATTELRTDQLLIDFDNERAVTQSAVTIKRNRSIMQAVGMELQFNNQEIRLFSSVRGQHDY